MISTTPLKTIELSRLTLTSLQAGKKMTCTSLHMPISTAEYFDHKLGLRQSKEILYSWVCWVCSPGKGREFVWTRVHSSHKADIDERKAGCKQYGTVDQRVQHHSLGFY